LQFRLQPLRFSFIARESIHFAEGKSANTLRGAFGTIFRRIACVPQCTEAGVCELRANCPYARLFEPRAIAEGPSGLADWPRPFVFRATHLDGRTFAPGATFHFDLNLFDTNTPAIAYLVLTFAQVARDGLGASRSHAELCRVEQLDENGCACATVYEKESATVRQNVPAIELSLMEGGEPITRLRVRFVTPTELKSGQQLAPKPEFGVLASRIRDRISTLRELYGAGPLEIDFRGFGERAREVRMTRCELRNVDVLRRSSRTRQVHPIGGFVGEAEYEGDLGEFVPYLRVAKWTGVGRQTVWGKGEIALAGP
jgi:hypothetical protein